MIRMRIIMKYVEDVLAVYRLLKCSVLSQKVYKHWRHGKMAVNSHWKLCEKF